MSQQESEASDDNFLFAAVVEFPSRGVRKWLLLHAGVTRECRPVRVVPEAGHAVGVVRVSRVNLGHKWVLLRNLGEQRVPSVACDAAAMRTDGPRGS